MGFRLKSYLDFSDWKMQGRQIVGLSGVKNKPVVQWIFFSYIVYIN